MRTSCGSSGTWPVPVSSSRSPSAAVRIMNESGHWPGSPIWMGCPCLPQMEQLACTSLSSLSLGMGLIVTTRGQQKPAMAAQATVVCQEIKWKMLKEKKKQNRSPEYQEFKAVNEVGRRSKELLEKYSFYFYATQRWGSLLVIIGLKLNFIRAMDPRPVKVTFLIA